MKLESKIKLIDSLLKDDEKFEKYINNIDKTKPSSDFKENLLKKCRQTDINEKNKKAKIKYTDILKMVACAVFAVIIWEGSLQLQGKKAIYEDTKEIEIKKLHTEQEQVPKESIINKVNDAFLDMSRQFVVNYDIKKEDKK